jgi:hypothetical protein
MDNWIDPELMDAEALRMEPGLRRLCELRRGAADPDLATEESAIKAMIESASRPLNQE